MEIIATRLYIAFNAFLIIGVIIGTILHFPQWIIVVCGVTIIQTICHEFIHAGVGKIYGLKIEQIVLDPIESSVRFDKDANSPVCISGFIFESVVTGLLVYYLATTGLTEQDLSPLIFAGILTVNFVYSSVLHEGCDLRLSYA